VSDSGIQVSCLRASEFGDTLPIAMTPAGRLDCPMARSRALRGTVDSARARRLEHEDMEDATRASLRLPVTGMSVRETAEEIGIAKSVVRRMKQKIEREAKEVAGSGEGG